MANTISKLSVLLSANVSGFTSGMRSAVAPLKSFTGQIASVGSKVIGFGSALTALAAGAGMTALVKGAMESIDVTAKLSDRLGITTEALTGLQHAADLSGVSNEALTGGLEKMLRNLSQAATEGGNAGAALARLGLDAKELVNAAPDAAFKALAEGLLNVQNPAERAALAMEVFGKSGQSLLPLMLAGKDGIEAAQKEAEKLGLTFSRLDAAKVEAANDSMTRLKAVFVGVARTLAVQLAPFIDVAAAKLTDLATSGGGMGTMVVNAFEWVLTAVAKAADWLELLNAGWHSMRGVAGVAIFGVVKTLELLIKGVEWLSNKLLGTESTWGETFGHMSDALKETTDEAFKKAGESWDNFTNGVNSAAVASTFADIRARADESAKAIADNAAKMRGAAASTEDFAAKLKAAEDNAKKVTDTITDLQKQVTQFSMSDTDKKLVDLSALGATPEQMAQAKQALDQLDALNAAKKKSDDLQQKAKSVIESVQTPTQQYDEQITSLSEMLNAGLLSWQEYGLAVRKAREELEKSADVKPTEAPDLIRSGSAEALKLAFENSSGVQRLNKKDLAKEQLAAQDEANRHLRELVRNSRPGDSDVTTLDI